MKPMCLLALLLLPALTRAEETGERAFEQSCARCHPASPSAQKAGRNGAKPASQRKSPGPQLDTVLSNRTPEQLRAWLQAPQKVRPETRCDTRMLAPGEVDAVLSYLATRSQPPPPPREELLRQQLQKELAERRARKQRQPADSAQPRRTP
ncbi:cytochrome c family protein [Myxococcus sp. RHSTA-1-4]|uniref:c-type cytochrome n=1 Tax=Myxococcus sp. RHSTA-1-4 TaxID=2874601 RepID=UPI001CBF59BC|nr:c-type cytochrome [Myxococcus sp. RHSTA-1-4]MBZ4420812.1 c-type cytochrome [Myxococcus sp. RHSTA-1-4]